MARKKIYSEVKRGLNLTLTDTAIKWLESQQTQLTASSLSDAIERMARKLPESLLIANSVQEFAQLLARPEK